MAFIQQFKKTQEYLISLNKNYYIYDMLRYHAVGYNSKPNYVALFYGIKHNETYIKKKSLFNYFHDNGYITISLPGYCDNNLMNYAKPKEYGADHNINLACHPSINKYYLKYNNSYNNSGAYGTGPRCIYGKRISYMFIDYLKEAQIYYTNHNISSFSYISFSETHDANQLSVAGIDNKLKKYFRDINNSKALQNIITIIVGDHGIHYGKYYNCYAFRTLRFLSSNNYFGLNETQFYIIKQSSVPCFSSTDGDLEYKNKFILKPHGHGDIHHLLYKNKILEKWIEQGIEDVIIFQDTNSLALNSVYALLGACRISKKDVLFLSTERYIGEKASVICSIEEKNISQFRAIDYCRLPAFNGEDINNIKEGAISEYINIIICYRFPGVTNIICFEINSYNNTLQKTKGILPNFVLPKVDKYNRLSSPVRLECVLQDYPLLLSDTSNVDHLKMERWQVFNPVKESSNHNMLYSFVNGANLFNQKFKKCLEYCGCKIGKNVKLYISPSTAISYKDYEQHFSKNICICDNSTLQLYGNILINKLYLDGKLMITVKEGFTAKFDCITLKENRTVEINIKSNIKFSLINF